jgi:L-alanine-DL-glutamate epimerase-like enolase superfamily enzyme
LRCRVGARRDGLEGNRDGGGCRRAGWRPRARSGVWLTDRVRGDAVPHPCVRKRPGRLRLVMVARFVPIIAVTKFFADRTSLRVDLNGAWDEPTSTRCCRISRTLASNSSNNPCRHGTSRCWPRVAERLTIPVMADESLLTPQGAAHLVRQRACDLFAV